MNLLRFAALCLPSLCFAAESGTFEITVNDIPPNTSEVVVLLTAAAPNTGPGYDDGAPPPPPGAPAAPAPAAPPAGVLPGVAAPAPAPAGANEEPPRRRRRAGAGGAGPRTPAPTRVTMAPDGQRALTIRAVVSPRETYHARVVALRRGESFPIVIAGAHREPSKLAAGETQPLQVSLKAPTLKLAATNPSVVAPGARFQLAGTLTDPSRCLGAKNRMRVWLNEGSPPATNHAGSQVSTVDVTTEGDDVHFTFELTAPNRPTTLYYQFGELPSEFAHAETNQAPFLILPNVSAGERALSLRVE